MVHYINTCNFTMRQCKTLDFYIRIIMWTLNKIINDSQTNLKRTMMYFVYIFFIFFDLKGALEKYNIYLFVSYSIEDFELNQYWNFQLILPMSFHFMRYFVNSIIFRVSHWLLFLLKLTFKKIENAINIDISSKVNQSRM